MKAKLNFKSRRTISVISIIAVLAIVAGVSAYFFTKGNDTAGATNAGQEEQASNNGVAITENNNGQNGQNNAPESNSNQPNSQDSTPNANQNDGTQNNDGVNNGTTGETGNNQGVANANQGTTGTNTGATTQPRRTNNNVNTTTTNIPGANTDATTTYEQVEENIVVENPWESHMVEWTPENVKTAVVSAKEVTGRDINIEKTAETSTGKTAVSVGDEITYKIKITNNEEKVLNSLYIKDSIPEGTEFVSIDELGTVNEEKTQVSWNLWNLGLKKGESKEVSFKVKVTEKAKEIKTIKNIAYAENTPSDEDKPTKNPVLESSKSHEIVRNNEVIPSKENVPAKIGDKIEYTITVKNLGEVEGTTSIKDSDLAAILENEKATLEGNIILKNGNGNGTKIEKDDLINGFDITVKANETATVKFSLVVNKVDGKIKNVATIGGSKEDEDIVETEGVQVTKNVTSTDKDNDGKYDLDEIIKYEVEVKNIGSITLNNVVVNDDNSEEKTKTIDILAPGETKTVEFTHKVVEDDIKAGKVINKATAKDTPSNEVTTPTESANPSIDVQKTIVKVKDTEIPEDTEVTIKAQKDDKITYQIVATNNGNTTLSNVKITDDKNVTLESATLPERLADITITTGNTINANTNLLGRNDITLQPGETITLTVSYTLQKADVLGSKDFVNTATATGKYDKTEPKDENSATIETEFTPEMGEKSVEKVWDDENYASNRPKEITVQLMNGTTKVGDPVKLSETNGWKHTWTQLPLEDENGKAITYKVEEDKVENYTTTYSKEQNGKFVITNSYNKPKAGGTITIHSTKSQEVNAPLDVVFILDTSGSMDDNSRATNAVTAINKAIAQVQGYNEHNRVGVVGFSGTYDAYTDGLGSYHPGSKDKTDSTELLKLDRYTAKTTSNDVKQYLTINKDNQINTNVNELKTQNGRYVDGATYTQIGIAEAANMLQKADKKVTIDGVEVTRTPVIILISDGEPTYYTENYKAVTSQNRGGNGSSTTADYGYYTILSANYYKQQVTTHYGRTAMMYTIGIGISKDNNNDLFARTVLNPDTDNKNACKATYDRWSPWQSEEYNLYDKIKNTSNYADGAYFGEMTEDQLTKILEKVIQGSIPKERTEKITAEQIKNAKVELKDIDTTKEFSLKAGETTYNTFANAKTAGVIAGDETNGYYVDLTKVPAGSDLEISYHEK